MGMVTEITTEGVFKLFDIKFHIYHMETWVNKKEF